MKAKRADCQEKKYTVTLIGERIRECVKKGAESS